jgi:hypothetical protein
MADAGYEKWVAAHPNVEPFLYFALKHGTSITDRAEENVSIGVMPEKFGGDVVAYIAHLYDKRSANLGIPVRDLLEHFAPEWAK